MHLNRKISWRSLVQHLLFWMLFISYHAVTAGWEENDQLTFVANHYLAELLFVCIPLTYINLYVLMPLYYYPQQYMKYALGFVVLFISGGLFLRFFTHQFVLPWEQLHDPERYRREVKQFWIPIRIIRNSVTVFPIVLIAMLIELIRYTDRQGKNLRELEREKFAAELGLLKSQINPHFFFNTLNSLYALTLKGSDKAAGIVLRLSNLMHYMLYDASAAKVLLKDEISHLQSYISIEQMRFADRLELSFQYSGDIEGKMIAPLLMLPFVENAFKHGLSENAGWITITLKVIDCRLFLKVENSYNPETKVKVHGLGLINVRRRLELTYPEKYKLQLNRNDGVFEADLKLDL